MSLPQKIKLIRINLAALLLCIAAFGIYSAFSPVPVRADEGGCGCVYADQHYSDGACRCRQKCSCNADCTSCIWVNDPNCDPRVGCLE
jgi:hypothetical protein